MRLPSRWPLAAVMLSLTLVLTAPSPAGASACDLLHTLGACTPSEPELVFTPEGLITLPGQGPSVPSTPPPPSSPTLLPDAAHHLLDLANQERARVGAPALVFRADVMQLAEAHTRKMIQGSGGGIFHNLDLLTEPLRQTLGALVVGENVGRSLHVDVLHPSLMASPPHRAALLDPRFTVAGFAVIHHTNGFYYLTQDFIQPSGGPPAAPPSPPSPAPPPRAAAPPPVPVVTADPAAPSGNAPTVDPNAGPGVAHLVVPLEVDRGAGGVPELAVGEVAGLVVESASSARPSGRAGPVGVALLMLLAAMLGQGWWWFRRRPGF